MGKFNEETLLLMIKLMPNSNLESIQLSSQLFFDYVNALDKNEKKILAESKVLDEFFVKFCKSKKFLEIIYTSNVYVGTLIYDDNIILALKERVAEYILENTKQSSHDKILELLKRKSYSLNNERLYDLPSRMFDIIFSDENLYKSKKFKKSIMKNTLKDQNNKK